MMQKFFVAVFGESQVTWYSGPVRIGAQTIKILRPSVQTVDLTSWVFVCNFVWIGPRLFAKI